MIFNLLILGFLLAILVVLIISNIKLSEVIDLQEDLFYREQLSQENNNNNNDNKGDLIDDLLSNF